ncbi:YfgM family protein [Vibrio salinus]|uniref:YfgM family protein n=1 Tax=Vibrio salinus TaxID=2899784 RepID=UPI001E64496D|nr:YfgM family protein [Vibrio salinus]MCE0493170.1 YfgM family protein [Vibrio salinus]
MELYDTEEQQVEAIKDWWKQNGKSVIIGAVVGLAAIGGWKYYQNYVKESQEAASHAYEKTISVLSSKGAKAETDVQAFIDGHADSQYSVLAALQLAKIQIDANHLDEGLAQLEWAKSHTDDNALSTLINFRIARVLSEQGDYAKATSSLDLIKDESWKGRVLELKGDIALRQGDKDAAYVAYTEAQQAKDASQTLQFKLDDLTK